MQTYRPTLGVLCQKEMSSAKSGVCEHPLFLTVLASNEGCFLYPGKKKSHNSIKTNAKQKQHRRMQEENKNVREFLSRERNLSAALRRAVFS